MELRINNQIINYMDVEGEDYMINIIDYSFYFLANHSALTNYYFISLFCTK